MADDTVLPFQVDSLDVRGRIVRLGPLLDQLLLRHDYPHEVSALLAEATALGALLGSAFKFEGRFTLQTMGDGPVPVLVVDMSTPDGIRACVNMDRPRALAAIGAGRGDAAALVGAGHLAMTVDQGAGMQRYQGLVALDGTGLETAARTYFLQSEQIPTMVRLAVAPAVNSFDGRFRSPWRAAGFLVQFLPTSPERRRMADLPPGDAPPDWIAPVHRDDEAWTTARLLAETLTNEELIDPSLSPEDLLFRLYHEHGVRVFDAQPLVERCRCSEDRVREMIRRFTHRERADMVVDGNVDVTCEFCSRLYRFKAEAIL